MIFYAADKTTLNLLKIIHISFYEFNMRLNISVETKSHLDKTGGF